MANPREMNVTLLDWEARIILESISREMQRVKLIAETSDDEDEIADAGNDCMEIAGLKERLEEQAKSIFGKQICNFSLEVL